MDKTDSVSELFSDQNNQNAKQIQYDEAVVKSQIDMVGKRIEYEPTSGSSVVIVEVPRTYHYRYEMALDSHVHLLVYFSLRLVFQLQRNPAYPIHF